MVSGRSDGGAQILSVRVRRIIQSIKEIVGDRSDAEIYDVLRETNMDPNETAQKLLNQDPFHEVKRKRDKKKENTGYRDFTESRNQSEHTAQWTRSHTSWDRNIRRGGFAMKSHTGISREFRVVRDNRVKFNADQDTQPSPTQHPSSATEQMVLNVLEKSSSTSIIDKKEPAGNSDRHMPSQSSNSTGHSQFANSIASHKPLLVEEKRVTSSNLSLLEKKDDKQNSLHNSTSLAPNNYVVGVYSSSSDPVHVPSPNSRSAGKVGAIKREVGVVGGRRKPSERSATHLSLPSSSISVSSSTKDISVPTVSLRHSVKSSQFGTSVSEPIMPGLSSSRPSSANQYSIKQHQQPLSHQKALQHNMEWKPKSSKKPGAINSRVIGTATANLSSEVDNTVGGKVEETFLSERLSQVNIENVIIPQHLRVPDTEQSQLTFGSFGVGSDSVNKSSSAFHSFGNEEDSYHKPCTSISISVPGSSGEDASSGGLADSQDGQTRTSQCGSPTPPLEPQPSDRIESSLQSMEEYADIGLVRSDCPSYSQPEQQKLQNPPSFPSFSAYDPQTSYDMTFFRTVIDENICSQGLTSSSEAVSSHPLTSSGATSSVAMVQQQQQPIAQLYPQLHMSHYPNFMQYRQFIPPVFVPPVAAMPNYSGNPAYPHPPNANSYVLLPSGGNSHISAGVKYGTSQYKPVAAASSTGYGNYTGPAGYAISAPGAIGATTGLDDVTRMKYKDNNLYIPNPQAETSEIWLQNPRDIQTMQTTPYYNMPSQGPHPAYLPVHAGHASFNAAAAAAAATQSSHMQFPGAYHPQQLATMGNLHHHLVPQQVQGIGGNVGIGIAGPAAQGGAFQPQSQLGHLNWTGNF